MVIAAPNHRLRCQRALIVVPGGLVTLRRLAERAAAHVSGPSLDIAIHSLWMGFLTLCITFPFVSGGR
jgi:hypothetical protein